jgi:2-amino-4-hydroxy-6-hydroxymethyldihydropteridine diphosphokinase
LATDGPPAQTIVAVALGSNLGDRVAHLHGAIRRLDLLLRGLRASRFLETAPVGVTEPQPFFLNAAAVGRTTHTPRELMDALLAIERDHGRSRPFAGAPRTLDLDLILYGDVIIDEAGLSIPHPRFRHRRFVLEPLAELAPTLKDPVTGKTVMDLLLELR